MQEEKVPLPLYEDKTTDDGLPAAPPTARNRIRTDLGKLTGSFIADAVLALLVVVVAGCIAFVLGFYMTTAVVSVGPNMARLVRSGCHRPHHSTPDTKMYWRPCPQNSTFECGHLTVPKDYFDKSAGVARIALLRYKATSPKKDRLGSIFLNPGGPGGQGTEWAYRGGPPMSKLLDGRYDIVGFDPRGIGLTEPRVECFESARAYADFKAHTVLERGFEVHPDPWSAEGRASLLRQHKEQMALQEAEFRKCGQSMGDELKYMGTSTVVRDIDYISKVLDGEDGKINYYGASYGTILGAFLVNMMPAERIGRVIIDGVASAPQWVNEPSYNWLHDWIKYTDSAFEWFARDCATAGPKGCALAKDGDEGRDIQDRLLKFLDDLYENGPVAVPDGNRPGLLTSGLARTTLYASTNNPGWWPGVASAFNKAIDGNYTALYNLLTAPLPSPKAPNMQTDLSRVAVACVDSPPFKNEADWPTAELLVNKTLHDLKASPNFGASVHVVEPDGGCQWWPAAGKAPERFTGPFNNKLETPMLILSNTVDPITPLTSGREINKLMGDSSRLLIQNSVGHCTLTSVSICTARYWRNYFLEGSLPENEHVCQIDRGYLPGAPPNTERKMSITDAELLSMSQELSDSWRNFMSDFEFSGAD